MARWILVEYRPKPEGAWTKSYWFKGTRVKARLEAVFKMLLPDRTPNGKARPTRPDSQARVDGKPVSVTARERREWANLQNKKERRQEA